MNTGSGGWLGRYNPVTNHITPLGVLPAGIDPKTCASTGAFIGCTGTDATRLWTWRQNLP